MRIATFAFLMLVLAPQPTTLRYKHVVGQAVRYAVTQNYSVSFQAGDQPARQVAASETNLVEERRVVSVTAGVAKVLEHALSGAIERALPLPKLTQVVPETPRTYTFDRLGRCLSMTREATVGKPAPASQFLDGLAVPMPTPAVSAGATWSGETAAAGPNGKGSIKIAFKGKVAGTEKRLGRTCVRLEIALSARFTQPATEMTKESASELTGRIVQLFDAQAGLDVATDATLTMVMKSNTEIDGKPVPALWTTELKSKQALTK